MLVALVNCTIYTGEEVLQRSADWAVVVEAGRVVSVVPRASLGPEVGRVRDLGGRALAPALVDLQVYGGDGQLFAASPSHESLEATVRGAIKGGAGYICPAIMTQRLSTIRQGVEVVRSCLSSKAGVSRHVLGLHLEGPFLSPSKKGAHDESLILAPTEQAVQSLLDILDDHDSGGTQQPCPVVRLLTVAPEQFSRLHPPDQCRALLTSLTDRGLLLSAGHSDATYEEATAAFEEGGVGLATHLFNAMSPLQARAPGLVGAIWDHAKVRCSVVADGHHVSWANIRLAHRLMGRRLFLITDAVVAGEHQGGGGYHYHATDQGCFQTPTGTLAGSSLTMWEAVRNVVRHCDIPLDEALRMGSLYAAEALQLEDRRIGRIADGYEASFVVFDEEEGLQLVETLILM